MGQGWWAQLFPRRSEEAKQQTAWAAALHGTRIGRVLPSADAADPAVVIPAVAEFVAMHHSDPHVLFQGMNGLLWLLDAAKSVVVNNATAQISPGDAGCAAQVPPRRIPAGPLLLAAVRGVSAPKEADNALRQSVVSAACWLVRDVVSQDNSAAGLIDLRDAALAGEAAERAPAPEAVAEALSEALARSARSAETAGAACQALRSLLAADW